jgi:hypothetical protein
MNSDHHGGYGQCGGLGKVWVDDGVASNWYVGGSCPDCERVAKRLEAALKSRSRAQPVITEEAVEAAAKAISGAPFPSKASFAKARAALTAAAPLMGGTDG